MSDTPEIHSAAIAVDGSEQEIGVLAKWWPMVDVYATGGGDPASREAIVTLYAEVDGVETVIGAARIQPGTRQRVLSVPGNGTTMRATVKGFDGAAATKHPFALVGWDPGFAGSPQAEATGNPSLAVDVDTLVASLAWFPRVSASVDGAGEPDARGSVWTLVAVVDLDEYELTAALYRSGKTALFANFQAGASSFKLVARSPGGASAPKGSIAGWSNFQAAGGVTSVSGALPITSTGGTTPVIGINDATDASSGAMSAADKTKLDALVVGGGLGFGAFGARPVSGTAPGQRYQADPGYEYVWDGTLWRPRIGLALGYQPPAAAGWTAVNATGTLAIADANGALLVTGVNDGTITTRVRGFEIARAGGAMIVEASFAWNAQVQFMVSGGYGSIGLAVRKASTTKGVYVGFDLVRADGANTSTFRTFTGDGFTSDGGSQVPGDNSTPMVVRIRDDGSGTTFLEWSRDRATWTDIAQGNSYGNLLSFGGDWDQVCIMCFGIGMVPIALCTSFAQY